MVEAGARAPTGQLIFWPPVTGVMTHGPALGEVVGAVTVKVPLVSTTSSITTPRASDGPRLST